MSEKTINVLFSYNDKDGNYTRHCAVTILSLLESNKKNKIKIWILSPYLQKDNIEELSRIVNSYNQKIEFIIKDDLIPQKLKSVIINGRTAIRGPRYRYFFPEVIKNVDRILYLDCDVLVVDDIAKYYNMDMHGKAIAGYLDIWPAGEKHRKNLELDKYINSGVLLFDAKKYDVSKINVKKMKEINEKYSKFFWGWDQDKINIIFNDDFYITDQGFNYQISNRWFNEGIKNATIIHCLEKPWVKLSSLPNNFKRMYKKYLSLTKRSGYPDQKPIHGYIYNTIYVFLYYLFWTIVGKISGKYHH